MLSSAARPNTKQTSSGNGSMRFMESQSPSNRNSPIAGPYKNMECERCARLHSAQQSRTYLTMAVQSVRSASQHNWRCSSRPGREVKSAFIRPARMDRLPVRDDHMLKGQVEQGSECGQRSLLVPR